MPRGKYGPAIQYSGPFFEKDIKKTFRQNARAYVQKIAEEGADMVQANLVPGAGRLTGDYASSVHGRVTSLQGRKWALTAVVTATRHLTMPGHKGFGLFLETGIKGGRKTTFRGLWVFRRVGTALKRGGRVNQDLTKGLN